MMTSFEFGDLTPTVVGDIDATHYTVSSTVPKGTNMKALAPTIMVSAHATVSPVSEASQDFTNPVTYTVTAEDGSTHNYVVTVKVATTVALSFSDAVRIYANKRIQFNQDCVPSPYQVSFKKGATIMLENGANKTRVIRLDDVPYTIKAYGFVLVTLTTNATLPHNIMVDCGNCQNNATINLQQ